MKSIKAAIVGCGNIAATYADQIREYDSLEVVGFSDIERARTEQFATKYKAKAYAGLDEVLADPDVALVINLTIHHAHVEVITACLEAGKHVHTEKPLAMTYAEAERLVALAESRRLRLSSAPATFLGEPAQTLIRELRAGRIGSPRLAYAENNHGRIEAWHPSPEPFYRVGPLWDVSVYPLGILAAACGPMRRVHASSRILKAERASKEGAHFRIESPDYFTALIDFDCGMVARLTTNFYAKPSRQAAMMEFHGDLGALHLGSSFLFDSPIEFASPDGEFEVIAPVRPGKPGIEFARGAQDLAEAMIEGRPHRCDARVAAHVVEVIEAVHISAKEGRIIELKSTCEPPAPMPWAN